MKIYDLAMFMQQTLKDSGVDKAGLETISGFVAFCTQLGGHCAGSFGTQGSLFVSDKLFGDGRSKEILISELFFLLDIPEAGEVRKTQYGKVVVLSKDQSPNLKTSSYRLLTPQDSYLGDSDIVDIPIKEAIKTQQRADRERFFGNFLAKQKNKNIDIGRSRVKHYITELWHEKYNTEALGGIHHEYNLAGNSVNSKGGRGPHLSTILSEILSGDVSLERVLRWTLKGKIDLGEFMVDNFGYIAKLSSEEAEILEEFFEVEITGIIPSKFIGNTILCNALEKLSTETDRAYRNSRRDSVFEVTPTGLYFNGRKITSLMHLKFSYEILCKEENSQAFIFQLDNIKRKVLQHGGFFFVSGGWCSFTHLSSMYRGRRILPISESDKKTLVKRAFGGKKPVDKVGAMKAIKDLKEMYSISVDDIAEDMSKILEVKSMTFRDGDLVIGTEPLYIENYMIKQFRSSDGQFFKRNGFDPYSRAVLLGEFEIVISQSNLSISVFNKTIDSNRDFASPHINGGKMCEGSFEGALNKAFDDGNLYNLVILILEHIKTYGTRSPHKPLHRRMYHYSDDQGYKELLKTYPQFKEGSVYNDL